MNATNPKKQNKLTDLISEDAIELLSANGIELVEKIGIDVVRGVVLDVLTGKNLRDSTESLTRRRIATLNLALLEMFVKGASGNPNFIKELLLYASERLLEGSLSKQEKWIANWILGLTGKGVQNILRDDPSSLAEYVEKYKINCQEVVDIFRGARGDLTGTLSIGSEIKAEIDLLFLTYFLNTVGAETLTIRGSEKSAYGKLFEKLILGSLLSILGFRFSTPDRLPENVNRVFWLSQQGEQRESDATLLYELGKGVRFDIGFIGRGNPEISLDKVTRFAREMELGQQKWYLATIIIVDRIGERSAIEQLARKVSGTIVQMSMSYWPKQVAIELMNSIGYSHKLAKMPDDEIEDYLREKMTAVPLELFIGLCND